MKNMNYLIIIMLFPLLPLSSCEKGITEKKYAVIINNNANHKIRYYVASHGSEHIYSDTLMPSQGATLGEILPSESGYRDSSVPWEEVFKHLPSDTLSVFVFNSDTLAKYPWDTVRSQYLILQRYDLSLKDLQNRNFEIEYPYDVGRGILKVWKP